MTSTEVERLGTHGWFERDHFDGAVAASTIARARVDARQFRPGGVSRDHHVDREVRGDELLWIEAEDVELTGINGAFSALRIELNDGAWLGLSRFELQLAHFPGNGSRYVTHTDARDQEDPRRVTAIVYLNPAWLPAHGGQLLLHTDPPATIAPTLGHLVVFLAAKISHEVLPSFASRLAATAWFYGS